MLHRLQSAIDLFRTWPVAWVLVLVGSSLGILAVDALLLEWSQHPFTAGMAAAYTLRTPATVLLYAISAWLLDLSLILVVWAILLPLLRRWGMRASRLLLIAALLAVAVPWIFSFTRYRIKLMLGPRLDFDLLLSLAGGSLRELISQAGVHWAPVIVLGALLCAVFVVGFRWIRTLDEQSRRLEAPSAGALWLGALVALGSSALLLAGTCSVAPGACEAVRDKPSSLLFTSLAARATDFDGDGAGWLARPPDPAPFDSRIHPWAVDIPGNGLDENGLAGDQPVDHDFMPARPGGAPRFARKPDVLLILLETFRADLLRKTVQDQEVTPFLNRLAGEAGSAAHAHASIPTTIGSRGQLLGGRMAPFPGQSTLLDDFAANGYFVAYFSGQDESFGHRSLETLSVDTANVFYDARQDPEKNTSSSDTPGHRAVSARWLNKRVNDFLNSYQDPRPLFLYINYHDTHYPYRHDDLENLLGIDWIGSAEIGPQNALAVQETYANAARNVDRAIEEIVSTFQDRGSKRGTVVIVTADHGENLFENGLLGHGLTLSDEETRVPLVIAGIGGDWPEPLALPELRDALTARLSRPDTLLGPLKTTHPNWVPDPERRILHLVANPARPSLLRLRDLDGSLLYDVKSGELTAFGADEKPLSPQPDDLDERFREIIHAWEAIRIQPQEASPPGP